MVMNLYSVYTFLPKGTKFYYHTELQYLICFIQKVGREFYARNYAFYKE